MKPLKWQNIQITDNKTDKTTRNHTVDLENRLLDGDEDLDRSGARKFIISCRDMISKYWPISNLNEKICTMSESELIRHAANDRNTLNSDRSTQTTFFHFLSNRRLSIFSKWWRESQSNDRFYDIRLGRTSHALVPERKIKISFRRESRKS